MKLGSKFVINLYLFLYVYNRMCFFVMENKAVILRGEDYYVS